MYKIPVNLVKQNLKGKPFNHTRFVIVLLLREDPLQSQQQKPHSKVVPGNTFGKGGIFQFTHLESVLNTVCLDG